MLYRHVQCYTGLYNVVQTCKCKIVMFRPCAFQRNAHRRNFQLGGQTDRHPWTSLNILEHPWTSWNILEHFGTFWNILEHSETFWNILEHCKCILEHSGFQNLEHSGTFWNILEHSGTFWNILEYSGTFWNCTDCTQWKNFNLGLGQTDGQTDIRTCWAASSQLKSLNFLFNLYRKIYKKKLDWAFNNVKPKDRYFVFD